MGTLTLTSSDATRIRDCASRAADTLVETAITVRGKSTWLAAVPGSIGEGAGVVYRTGDPTLYDGSAGIALAAWSSATALDRNDLATIALGAARHAVSAQAQVRGTGLFDGLTGIGLAALEVGDNANDARLKFDGLEILYRVAD